MAEKLLQFYEKTKELGGLKATMRLAVLTKIPSAKAQTEPDSIENIKTFERAIEEIKKEFK
ncbi:MAG: hypothetical protein PVH88_24740 [Ignavibacteria bacterium]|jgi:hypothetical protein